MNPLFCTACRQDLMAQFGLVCIHTGSLWILHKTGNGSSLRNVGMSHMHFKPRTSHFRALFVVAKHFTGELYLQLCSFPWFLLFESRYYDTIPAC